MQIGAWNSYFAIELFFLFLGNNYLGALGVDSPHGGAMKLIDFGLSKFFDKHVKMSRFCGTLAYMSPEVLAHSYTEKADMWSIGVIVYLLLLGTLPFGPFAAASSSRPSSLAPGTRLKFSGIGGREATEQRKGGTVVSNSGGLWPVRHPPALLGPN